MFGTVCRRNLFQSDRAATAASRVSHALARLMEEGQPTLQHGLERWLYGVYGGTIPLQTVAPESPAD